MIKRLLVVATLAFMPLAADDASAAACAGFSDVDDSSLFCSSVTWVRNRGVTQGCTLSQYCPDQDVDRLQMAAFLQRLGNVVIPQVLFAEGEIPFRDLGAFTHVCVVGPLPIVGHRRSALVDGTIALIASASPASFFVDAIVSTDGGNTWSFANQGSSPVYAPSQLANAAVVSGPVLLVPGDTFMAAMRIRREGVSVTNVTSGHCNLRASVQTTTTP
jgi:hypothetical protein